MIYKRRRRQPGDSPSPAQARMLRVVGDWISRHGSPPMMREIAKALEVSSSAVIEMLKVMEEKGLVVRDPKVRGSLQVTDFGRAFLDRDPSRGRWWIAGVILYPEDERAMADCWDVEGAKS